MKVVFVIVIYVRGEKGMKEKKELDVKYKNKLKLVNLKNLK